MSQNRARALRPGQSAGASGTIDGQRLSPAIWPRLRPLPPVIDHAPLILATRRAEFVRIVGCDLDADAIVARLLERVNDLAGFLDSQDVETQRTALFAFCRRIVADAQRREIVIETDLLGLAQKETPPGLPAGLCISNLPERNPSSNSLRFRTCEYRVPTA